jgi:hypothetical protein
MYIEKGKELTVSKVKAGIMERLKEKRILKETARDVGYLEQGPRNIRDINGNKVGTVGFYK